MADVYKVPDICSSCCNCERNVLCSWPDEKISFTISLLHPKLTTSLILIWLFNDLKQVSVDVIMILDDVTISYMYMKNCK